MTAGRPFVSTNPRVASCCFALLVGMCLTGIAGSVLAQQPQPTVAAKPAIHVMHMKNESATQPDQQNPAALLSYYGGPVISNIHVVVVLWGPGVSPTVTNQIGDFYQAITKSTYYDLLSEYATNLTPAGGGTGTNQAIGRGDYGGSYTISPSVCASSPCTLQDSQIESELLSQIGAGNLPTPQLDASGNVNTVYMTYFPYGVTIVEQGESSCQAGGFCAYHGTTTNTLNSKHLLYGVLPDFGPGSACYGGCGAGTEFENITSVSSHEMAEAATDPDVGIARQVGSTLAWYDANRNDKDGGGEIGDICTAEQAQVSAGGSTYTIQKLWSNLEGACVSIGENPSFLLTAPATFSPGTAFNLTVAAQNPTVGADTSFIGTVHFTSGDPKAVLPADYTFTTTDKGTQSFGATLMGSGLQTITATDTVNGAITATSTLTGKAAGTAPTITSASSTAFTESAAGTFTVTATGTPTPSLSETGALPSGVSFVDNGNGSGTLSGIPAAGSNGTYNLIFKAHNTASPDATQNFSLTVNASTTAQVSFSPSSVSFGNVFVNTVARKVVTVKNTGKSTLTITNIALTQNANGRFASTSACASVAPGKTCSVAITFSSPSAETDQATLNITDNAPGSPQGVAITATAKVRVNKIQISFDPDPLTFTDARVGTTNALVVTLTNIGTTNLSVQDLSFTGADALDFSYLSHCPATVAANDNCTVSIFFSPSAVGLRTANFVVEANGGATVQSLSVSGTGK